MHLLILLSSITGVSIAAVSGAESRPYREHRATSLGECFPEAWRVLSPGTLPSVTSASPGLKASPAGGLCGSRPRQSRDAERTAAPNLSDRARRVGVRTVAVIQHAVVQVALAVAHVIAAARRLCTARSQIVSSMASSASPCWYLLRHCFCQAWQLLCGVLLPKSTYALTELYRPELQVTCSLPFQQSRLPARRVPAQAHAMTND